ncbi:GH3 auxin-responsive promoter [Phlebopus sp. FC_14]|nr:GH3 auxin-responsive promoter [Phlebopus sp. FC_14]
MPRPPCLSLSPDLSQQLEVHTKETLSRIIKANANSQYAQTTPELSEFRAALVGVDANIDDRLLEAFRRVHFTSYESYAPFFARFMNQPCRQAAVDNLFAPGLPAYLTASSSTSGGASKIFARYDHAEATGPQKQPDLARRSAVAKGTTAFIWYLGYRLVCVTDEKNNLVKKITYSSGTVASRRDDLALHPDRDKDIMATILPGQTAPYAAAFINNWRSFLVVHGLFAMVNKPVETMTMAFINTLVDMIRYVDDEFDMLVDCIETGVFPDLEGIAHLRCHLETKFPANPERAAELRTIGRPSACPGWCGLVWPHLRKVVAIASGVFAASVPQAQRFLGPNIEIHARGYAASEGWIGSPYDPLNLNQFKVTRKEIIEFLDVSREESISSVIPAWEVEVGKRYEIVMTTRDGLWRYRIGDVIEVCGFGPSDGSPIISFVERRNVAVRFADFVTTEKQLTDAILSVAPRTIGQVFEFTVIVDSRVLPPTYGYLVELVNETECHAELASQLMLETLIETVPDLILSLDRGKFRKPSINIVQPGTFREFRQRKLETGGSSLGQIKIPVVLTDEASIEWILTKVVKEL